MKVIIVRNGCGSPSGEGDRAEAFGRYIIKIK